MTTQSSGGRGRIRFLELVAELGRTVAARPGRTAAAAISVFFAAAAYVATTGLSATLSQQVTDRFDAARATEVDAAYTHLPGRSSAVPCPTQALGAARQLAGAEDVGQFDIVKAAPVTSAVDAKLGTDGPLFGVTAGALSVVGVHLSAGRLFDDGHVKRADPVALISMNVAAGAGIRSPGQTIRIGGQRLVVIGLITDVERRPDILSGVLLPSSTLARLDIGPQPDDQRSCGVIVATRPGAAAQIAGQLPFALRPDQPSAFTVVAPPDPATFRRTVERPVRMLTFVLSLAALLIGAASIASTMSASVSARVGEIGLRKALGARGVDIAAQIAGESLLIGLLGALFGALAGCYTVIGVAIAHDWQPILSLTAAARACVAGSILGGLAGLVPAIRAARMPASEALRR